MLGARNKLGLTPEQIDRCVEIWQVLCGDVQRLLDVSEAHRFGSRTRFDERRGTMILGADVLPGSGQTPNARMSRLACLAHELAHAERFEMGYNRPFDYPDVLLDEAETSIHASFTPVLNPRDREDLVDDARERLVDWLSVKNQVP